MTKGKSSSFRGYQGKSGAPAAAPPAPHRKPAPPRVTVRPKPSSKGR